MGILDFLFEGKPPQSVTTYGQTVQNIPTWLSDYTQGTIARANAIAAEPYQTYGGPRIAGFSPLQQEAFRRTQANAGRYAPTIDQAIAMARENGGNNDTIKSGVTNINRAVSGPGALDRASGALGRAGQTFTGANVSEYMNPFIENVINRAGTLAGRQFREKIMPGLEDTFTASGQYGSTAHQQQAERASRDLAEGLQEQAQGALGQAYESAGARFGADANRFGDIGRTIGDLSNSDRTAILQSGRDLGTLGINIGDQGLRSASALGSLASTGQGINARDAASLEAVGSQQQNMGQRNLDLAYQDFSTQRDYPRNQLDWLRSVVNNLPVPSSTSIAQQGTANVYSPSPLAQLAALYASNQANTTQPVPGKRRGGQVRRFDEGGRARSSAPIDYYNYGFGPEQNFFDYTEPTPSPTTNLPSIGETSGGGTFVPDPVGNVPYGDGPMGGGALAGSVASAGTGTLPGISDADLWTLTGQGSELNPTGSFGKNPDQTDFQIPTPPSMIDALGIGPAPSLGVGPGFSTVFQPYIDSGGTFREPIDMGVYRAPTFGDFLISGGNGGFSSNNSSIADVPSTGGGGVLGSLWGWLSRFFQDDSGGTKGGKFKGGPVHRYAEGGKVGALAKVVDIATAKPHLVDEAGNLVKPGAKVKSFRGEDYIVVGHQAPKGRGKSGYITVRKPHVSEDDWQSHESYYPQVFDLKIKVPPVRKAEGGKVGVLKRLGGAKFEPGQRVRVKDHMNGGGRKGTVVEVSRSSDFGWIQFDGKRGETASYHKSDLVPLKPREYE